MNSFSVFLVLLFSALGGWLAAYVSIRLLFKPEHKASLAGISFQGILPHLQKKESGNIGALIQNQILTSSNWKSELAKPELMALLHPEIEIQVDRFLKEKLSTVFPLLYKFMGEKTLLQFKAVFIEETINLLPVMLAKYTDELPKALPIKRWVSDSILQYDLKKAEKLFYENAQKPIRLYQLAGLLFGLTWGGLILLLLHCLPK
jgi:uncharacterized membrane protein YheB (UPF0754 family)